MGVPYTSQNIAQWPSPSALMSKIEQQRDALSLWEASQRAIFILLHIFDIIKHVLVAFFTNEDTLRFVSQRAFISSACISGHTCICLILESMVSFPSQTNNKNHQNFGWAKRFKLLWRYVIIQCGQQNTNLVNLRSSTLQSNISLIISKFLFSKSSTLSERSAWPSRWIATWNKNKHLQSTSYCVSKSAFCDWIFC